MVSERNKVAEILLATEIYTLECFRCSSKCTITTKIESQSIIFTLKTDPVLWDMKKVLETKYIKSMQFKVLFSWCIINKLDNFWISAPVVTINSKLQTSASCHDGQVKSLYNELSLFYSRQCLAEYVKRQVPIKAYNYENEQIFTYRILFPVSVQTCSRHSSGAKGPAKSAKIEWSTKDAAPALGDWNV